MVYNAKLHASRYYGYRLPDSLDEDPRLRVLERSWFQGKTVMDIGCNDGLLTLSLACKFSCKSTQGVDIDPHLVGKACRSLAALHSKYSSQLASPPASHRCAVLNSVLTATYVAC
jgi:2-polyprenyl-3-methyl-5-hydroxy-6-metoxy-1,4-benzoquinol methylase